MSKKYRRSKQGFTLIELMVVVAVIAILAAIAIPSYLGIQKKSARSEAKATLQAISLALEGYMAENNRYSDGPYTETFTYTCGSGCTTASFTPSHPGNIEAVANLGNNLIYVYQITVDAADHYRVDASPMAGSRVEGDVTFWLTSSGTKGPAGW